MIAGGQRLAAGRIGRHLKRALFASFGSVLYIIVVNQETMRLLRQLIKSAKLTENRVDAFLGELDLSATKLLTLRHLEQSEEPVSLGALAHCMAFAKSNATQLIDHLEEAGLVYRVPSPVDRRCTEVAVTALGRERENAATQAIRPLADRLEATFSSAERARFLEYLDRLADEMS